MMPVDERGGDDADHEAAAHVDRERAHREYGGTRALDQSIDAVPGPGSERAAECDADDDGHGWLLGSIGAISRARRVRAGSIAARCEAYARRPRATAL